MYMHTYIHAYIDTYIPDTCIPDTNMHKYIHTHTWDAQESVGPNAQCRSQRPGKDRKVCGLLCLPWLHIYTCPAIWNKPYHISYANTHANIRFQYSSYRFHQTTVMHMFPSTCVTFCVFELTQHSNILRVACECKRMWRVILTNNARSAVSILPPGTAGTDP